MVTRLEGGDFDNRMVTLCVQDGQDAFYRTGYHRVRRSPVVPFDASHREGPAHQEHLLVLGTSGGFLAEQRRRREGIALHVWSR